MLYPGYTFSLGVQASFRHSGFGTPFAIVSFAVVGMDTVSPGCVVEFCDGMLGLWF